MENEINTENGINTGNEINTENSNRVYDSVGNDPVVNDPVDSNTVYDPVNNPAHYTDGKIETIEFIEDKKLGFCLGNAVKYISRAGKKDPTKEVEDLRKAIWYIQRRIYELQREDLYI